MAIAKTEIQEGATLAGIPAVFLAVDIDLYQERCGFPQSFS